MSNEDTISIELTRAQWQAIINACEVAFCEGQPELELLQDMLLTLDMCDLRVPAWLLER